MSIFKFVPLTDIIIPETRFRQLFTEKNLTGLQDSLSSGLGLSNAITLRKDLQLITGESRIRAITNLHLVGIKAYYNGEEIPEGTIPANIVDNMHEEISYLEAEFHENTKRESFTYIEEAQATTKIALLKQELLSKEEGGSEKPSPTLFGVALKNISKKAISETAEEIFDGKSGAHYDRQVKDSLLIVNAIEENPELRDKLTKVKTLADGQKILKKHAQEEQRSALAMKQGKSFSSEQHTVLHGDCVKEMKNLLLATYDVCVTDPIYGIGAGNFNDGAGKYGNFEHGYDDSIETFRAVMPKAIKQVSRILKDSAHMYLACDIRNYPALVDMVNAVSLPHNPWKVANAPFIQYKVGGGRVPHPGFTPRRSYEVWLYAYRGGKQEYKMINDVIPCEADREYGGTHGAGKPVELLKTFLSRSCMPGDSVIDFMAGSGSILPACHDLKLKCTAIELGEVYYGECLERLKKLR